MQSIRHDCWTRFSSPISGPSLPAPPTATLSIDPVTVSVGHSFTVTWSSTDTLNCTGTGGIPGLAWVTMYTSGSIPYVPTAIGKYTFGLSCASIYSAQPNATAQASVTVTAAAPAAAVTLTANPSTITKGQSITLTWSSTNATSCTASGGPAGTSWSGALATSGHKADTPSDSGSFTYSISCVGAGASGAAQAQVQVEAAVASGGGGGALDTLTLATLAGLIGANLRRRRPIDRASL